MKVLKSPNSNIFCVPASLSLLTGKHVDEITDSMKEWLGDEPISGVFYPIALEMLRRAGLEYRRIIKWPKGITNPILCCSKSHMFVIYKGKVYDNTNPEGTDKPRRYKILHAFEITNWKEPS